MIKVLLCLAAWLCVTAAQAAESLEVRPTLSGRVISADGQAVPNASVFIYTAGPRVGPGYI